MTVSAADPREQPHPGLRASCAALRPASATRLQLLLIFLVFLRIGRRAFVGLGEIRHRHGEADLRAVDVDRLHLEGFALLHLGDQFWRTVIIGHAAVGETGEERARQRLFLVEHDAGAVLQLQRARQRDAQDLLRFAVRLDQRGGNHRHAGLGAGVTAGETDLLGVGIRCLVAEFCPRGIDQRRHLALRRLGRCLLLLRGRRCLLLGWTLGRLGGGRCAGGVAGRCWAGGRSRRTRLGRRRCGSLGQSLGHGEGQRHGGQSGHRRAADAAVRRNCREIGHRVVLFHSRRVQK